MEIKISATPKEVAALVAALKRMDEPEAAEPKKSGLGYDINPLYATPDSIISTLNASVTDI